MTAECVFFNIFGSGWWLWHWLTIFTGHQTGLEFVKYKQQTQTWQQLGMSRGAAHRQTDWRHNISVVSLLLLCTADMSMIQMRMVLNYMVLQTILPRGTKRIHFMGIWRSISLFFFNFTMPVHFCFHCWHKTSKQTKKNCTIIHKKFESWTLGQDVALTGINVTHIKTIVADQTVKCSQFSSPK